MTLAEQIEEYLLERLDWVSTKEIVERFQLPDDRPLRSVKGKPGLCTLYAVSGDKGLKHVTLATTAEWEHFRHRIRRHAVSELVRLRDLGRRRMDVARQTRRFICERDSGQGLLYSQNESALVSKETGK